ncbi:MAG: hypothetical protein ABJC36_07140 [Gemmatimonadales bacterium]
MRRQTAALITGAVLCASSIQACGGPTRTRPPAYVAPWLRSDPQRCLIPRDLRESMEDMARRCAETFVRDNGYTAVPAEDSTRWVRELEEGGPWPRVLAARTGTLDRDASTVQCSRRECIVLFRVRRPMLLCAYRAVTMTQVFTRIRLASGGIRDVRCHERQV